MTMKKFGRGLRASALAGLCAAAACGEQQQHKDEGGQFATVSLAIKEAPADVSCIRVAAAGSRNVAASFDVNTGQSTVFNMAGLPIGTVSFRAEAFQGPCSTAGGEATYVSDVVTSVLKPGANPGITLTMRARATLTVGVDFPGLGPDAQWISFDSSAPGTQATAVIDETLSTADQTVISVQLHGLYSEVKTGPDGRAYQALFVPGLSNLDEAGSPQLPALRGALAMVTGGSPALDAEEVLEERVLPGVMPWPAPIAERDGEAPGSRPEQFVRNANIYDGRAPFPATSLTVLEPRQTMLGALEGATIELHPVRYEPSTGNVRVFTRATFTVGHKGEARAAADLIQDQLEEAASMFVNWNVVSRYVSVYPFFKGEFLFVYAKENHDALAPLIEQKKARGYAVTEMTTEETGTTCASIRAAIQSWHAATGSFGEHYALLVGDTNVIPLCMSASGIPTDDLYGSTNGDDLNPEVLVGRLSPVTSGDLANHVAKILRYEDTPSFAFNYGRTLLVAHKEGAPGKYVGAHEVVRTASYAVPPSFSTLYGNVAGVTNADVVDAISSGQGLVAYRGHGSETEWWSWNQTSQSFSLGDIMTLTNASTETPVVWSFACSNAALDSSPSIAEFWLRSSDHGAVAHYGASVPSGTTANHVLDQKMFEAVYTKNLTAHAKAMRWAEKQMMAAEPSTQNAWMYLLIGDPEMRIRRRAAFEIGKIVTPLNVTPCSAAGACPQVTISALDRNDKPLAGALVTIYKSGDEVQASGYTNANGQVTLTSTASTPGTIFVRARFHGDDLLRERIMVATPQ